MHPIFQSGARVVTFMLAWCAVGLLLTIAFAQDSAWTLAAVLFVPLGVVFGFVSLSAWYLCRSFPLDSPRSRITLITAHVGATIVASLLWVALGHSWGWIIEMMSPLAARELIREQRVLLLTTGALLFALALALHHLLIAVQRTQEQATAALALKLAASRAELEAVRAQIEPHFLFNSLNSISALVTSDAQGARTMCLALAAYFRDTLKQGATSQVSLADEVSLARQYLEIEKVRFGERLQAHFDVAPEAMSLRVPSLILQPLLENAIVHGIANLLEGGTVVVSASVSPSYLTVAVDNPFDADTRPRAGLGFGLSLVRKRLQAQYADAALLNVARTAQRFRVELKFPAAQLTDEQR